MTSVIDLKRRELLDFIRQVLEPEPSVQAVIAFDSLASGHIQPDSDLDLVVFFEPLDWYVVPGGFIWRPRSGLLA